MADDGFVLERSPSHLLHRAQQLAAGGFQRALGSDKITIRQFAVLAAIAGKTGQTQTDLVNATGIDRSTLADMVLRMEDNGLLTRGRAEDDGRAKSVSLTSAGRAAFNASSPGAKSADDALMAVIPRAKRAALIEALQALAEAAAQEPAAPAQPKRARKAQPKRKSKTAKKPARKPAPRKLRR
jgi:DNA-binding MarR family transcriptional regulator